MFQYGFMPGYQVVYITTKIPAPNGNSNNEPYQSSSHQIQQFNKESAKYTDKILEVENDVRAVEYRLEDLEFRRLRDLADEAMQMELLQLLQEQQQLQLLLLDLQQKELMMLREEDDFLVLLMAVPFYA